MRLRRRRSAFRTPTTAPPATAETSAAFGAVAFGPRSSRLGIGTRGLRRTGRTRLARRPRLLRSSSVRSRRGFFPAIASAATAASPTRPLALGLWSGHLLLRRPLLLGRTLRLRTSAARGTLRTAIASLLLLLLRAPFRTRRTRAAAALILLTSPLLELLNLPLHVLADGAVLAGPHLVETAVRTAFPAFGIGLLAGCAKDTFWQRHWRAGRIVHFQPCSPRRTPSAVKPCGR
jgi:hypothetical protein